MLNFVILTTKSGIQNYGKTEKMKQQSLLEMKNFQKEMFL